MTKINSEAKYQEILEEQKEIKSRLQKVESLLSQLTDKELFKSLSEWGRKFAREKGITKKQVLND